MAYAKLSRVPPLLIYHITLTPPTPTWQAVLYPTGVPEPLRQVVEACMQELPEARPTVGEFRDMVEAIEVV